MSQLHQHSDQDVGRIPRWFRRPVRRPGHVGVLVVLLISFTVLAYSPALKGGFVEVDDDLYVSKNSHVLAGLTLEGACWAWTTTHAANWHPLTWLSLMLDSQLFGTRPWGYHLVNLILHVMNALLLFVVLLQSTQATWRSGLVAGLFALHPLHVESVAWISERKDVLSTFFGMLTLLAYLSYAKKPGLLRYLPVALGMTLSLLAKPMLVTLPCILLLLDYWPLRRWRLEWPAASAAQPAGLDGSSFGQLVREKIPLLGLSVASSVVTCYAQRGAMASLEGVPLPVRLGNAAVSYGVYLRQTIFPFDLAPFYRYQRPDFRLSLVVALLLVVATALVVRYGRRHPYLPVGWLWYLGTLVPVIGLIQVGKQAQADRYTYVPLTGIFLLLVWGVTEVAGACRCERLAVLLAGAGLACLATLCWAQACSWQSSFLVW